MDSVSGYDLPGYHTSIALDQTDNPHISYQVTNAGTLRHAYHDGSGWHKETVDSTAAAGEDGETSIALDSRGNAHISYYDLTHGNADLKYAYFVPPVGGLAELPNVSQDPTSQSDAWGSRYVVLVAGLAAALLAVTAGAWYARRRWGT